MVLSKPAIWVVWLTETSKPHVIDADGSIEHMESLFLWEDIIVRGGLRASYRPVT